MTIITIATSKGGTGKTTLAAGLATFWAATGKRVVALDADNNRHLFNWLDGSGINCRPVAEDAILAEAMCARVNTTAEIYRFGCGVSNGSVVLFADGVVSSVTSR